jgi:hypothetical protein
MLNFLQHCFAIISWSVLLVNILTEKYLTPAENI